MWLDRMKVLIRKSMKSKLLGGEFLLEFVMVWGLFFLEIKVMEGLVFCFGLIG